MIPAKALRLAGDGAVLASRPRGVMHVYTGPLTPSGRYVPRGGRTACRAHTRRLHVIAAPTSPVAMTVPGDEPNRVCAHCSARLLTAHSGRVEHPIHRDQWRALYADTSKADLAFALAAAETPAEVDAVAHLSLLLFEVAGCSVPFTDRGRTASLLDLVAAARTRVDGWPAERRNASVRFNDALDDARARRRSQAIAAREERDRRIAQLGFVNATRKG